ncbi:MAG: dihydrodipicolinate synthase family protein, partial [Oscillospiraceae bacterium]
MDERFKGIFAALVTPYTESKEVSYTELKKLVRHLIKEGVNGFYVGGSTGEAFLLSHDERKKILEAVLEENAGERIVIAHVGCIGTDLAVDLAKHAESVGADAVSSIAPFYYKYSQDEICDYYDTLAN